MVAAAAAAAMFLPDLDPLCCDEEDQLFWIEDDGKHHQNTLAGDEEEQSDDNDLALLFQWEEEELAGLASKEAAGARPGAPCSGYPDSSSDPVASAERAEAVRWMVAAAGRLGFTAQTAVLAVDYLDRFLSRRKDGAIGGGGGGQQQPWMAQLSAVACLSLAAKVEETRVPLLLDLQVEETRFVFEARTVQRMELLVLSTLGWKMNPVTPLHFIDHFARRMASSPAGYIPHREFQRRCHALLLGVLTDSRWVRFLPSVLAAAAMLHTLTRCELFRCAPYSWDIQDRIQALLNANKADVDVCYRWMILLTTGCEPIGSVVTTGVGGGDDGVVLPDAKRKPELFYASPPSPNGVIDSVFSCDSSNDSWTTPSSSVSSSPVHPLFKKQKTAGDAEGNDSGFQQFHCRLFV